MIEKIKTCIYSANTDEQYTLALRNSLSQHPAIRIVTEAHDKSGLTDCLERLPVGLLMVDLDPGPQEALAVMEEISRTFVSLSIIALAKRADPELILSALRCGSRQFIAKPIQRQDLNKALDVVTRSSPAKVKSERIVCLMGASGGCGVTTIAANLAIELARLAADPCALVDLQLEFGTIASYFDYRPTHTIADLANSSSELDAEIVHQAMKLFPCDVAVLPRPERVQEAGTIYPERLGQILGILAANYDSVVVDTPRRFEPLSLTVLEMSAWIVVVLQLSVLSIQSAQHLYRSLTQYVAPEKIVLVANRLVRKSPLSLNDVEQYLGTSVFASVPNDYQTVEASLNFGRSLLSHSPTSPVRQAIADLAQSMYDGEPGAPAASSKPQRKAKLFSRLFGS